MGLRNQYKPLVLGFEIFAVSLFIFTFFFMRTQKLFMTFILISLIIFIFPNWLIYYLDSLRQQKLEEFYPDFVRDLSSSIKSGKPLPLALGELLDNDYGALNFYIRKLYYQVQWGIPVARAFEFFSILADDPIIERSMTTIIEAVKSGGELDVILDSIHKSLLRIKIIEEQRKSMVYKQIVQNYIIFFVFLIIMIILQNFLLPIIQQMAQGGALSMILGTSNHGYVKLEQTVQIDVSSFGAFFYSLRRWFVSIEGIFMNLILIQGFFTGFIIGKLSTGKGASGTKHSFILMSIGAVVMSLAQSLTKK